MQDDNRNESAFDKIKRRAEEADQRIQERQSHLTPKKHRQLDFFIADLFDAVSFRDDMASMEHPIFALKAGDKRTRFYEHNNIALQVTANHHYGLATIHDKDIWIYCISKLMQALYDGEEISRTIHFTAYDFLVTTNRDTSGRAYERLKDAMERLRGTSITTTIRTGNREEANGFGLIDSWRIIKEDDGGKMVNLSVTLPDWLYRSVTSKAVLTISPDYFRLRKPLDRRIYEIARKHCGHQPEFKIGLDLLHRKTGSTATLRKFKQLFKELAESNELPDYFVQFDIKKDMVIFKNRNAKAYIRDLFDGNC